MSWLETTLDDDPATLQAALAMLDEMDDSNESFGSPEASVDATPDDGDALEAEKPRGNVARNRQRHELLYLRDKVAQMEEMLTTLKRRRATVDNGENAMAVSKSAKLWEEMAARQRRQRRAVELENAKLQAMLRTQLKVGKDLIRLIRKSSQIYDASSLLVQPPKVNVTSTNLSADEHFARLYQLYTLIDSVFSNLPSGENITSLRDFTTSEDDPNRTIVNAYATWTLPFPLESVLDATWRSVAKEAAKKEMNLDVAHDEKEEATITVFRWDASTIFKWLQGEVVGSMVAKKYAHHAPNEAVIVTNWSATIEPVLPRIIEDMNMVEDCWMRIVQVPLDSVLDTEPMTRIQINRRLKLEIVTDDTTSQRGKAGMITEFVFNQFESATNWRQETIENLIFSSKIS